MSLSAWIMYCTSTYVIHIVYDISITSANSVGKNCARCELSDSLKTLLIWNWHSVRNGLLHCRFFSLYILLSYQIDGQVEFQFTSDRLEGFRHSLLFDVTLNGCGDVGFQLGAVVHGDAVVQRHLKNEVLKRGIDVVHAE